MTTDIELHQDALPQQRTRPTLIGLTGKMNAGKDTLLERMQSLFGTHVYRKSSFAAPLKLSAAALLDINVEQLEAMKNEPTIRVSILDIKGAGRDLGRSFSFREFLQRYGTEAHRDVLGEDFWVEVAMNALDRQLKRDAMLRIGPLTYVFTDVRFENEAQAIRDRGGLVYRVLGANDDTGEHASEAGLPDELIDGEIDNTHRPTIEQLTTLGKDDIEAVRISCMQSLDDEAARLHGEWSA